MRIEITEFHINFFAQKIDMNNKTKVITKKKKNQD